MKEKWRNTKIKTKNKVVIEMQQYKVAPGKTRLII